MEGNDGDDELQFIFNSVCITLYISSFPQLSWKSMAESMAIVPAQNNWKNQYTNPSGQ